MIPIATPILGEEEYRRIETVLEDGQLADGPTVRSFEEEFAAFCETDHAVATANGTAALQAALTALGIGSGDRVLTTPLSFVATANAARLVGAEVEFVDVDPETYAIDADRLATRLRDGPAVDAVIAVHLYGLPAPMQRLEELALTHDVALIEDAAQAHGATIDGTRVGSFGDAACFSFYPTKNMTTGEGGMVTTDSEAVAEASRRFVDHGRAQSTTSADRYEHVEVGHNLRMTSIAAAIGRAQLQRLPEFTTRRRENAHALNRALADLPIHTPVEPPDRTHVYHQYTIRSERRDRLQSALQERGIGTGVYYPTPIHRQPAYEDVAAEAPVAESLATEVLSLPVHPRVTTTERDRIVDAVTEAVAR